MKKDKGRVDAVLEEFEQIVGVHAVQLLRTQTDLQPFRKALAAALVKYSAGRNSVSLARLRQSCAEHEAVLDSVKRYLGEDNYNSILAELRRRP